MPAAAGDASTCLYSQAAQIVARQEWICVPARAAEAARFFAKRFGAAPGQLQVFGREDWMAPVASGSNPADAMVVCPCTMGTLGAIAAGLADNLIERAADVMLKERAAGARAARDAAVGDPSREHAAARARRRDDPAASPGFYHHPQSPQDLVDFVVARVLDQIGVPHELMPRWGEARERVD